MNNSFKNLFNKTDTIIAIIIYAMIVLLWNAAENFEAVSDLFAQNINDIDALIFQIETSQIILDDQSDNSCAMLAIITDVNGNPVEGIPVNFTTTYDYAVFEQSDNMVSGITGAVSNTLQNISSPDPSSIESIITA